MFGNLYDRALTASDVGSATTTAALTRLPVHSWLGGRRRRHAFDEAVVGLCDGPTIDLGCGPGRLVAASGAARHPRTGHRPVRDRGRPGPPQRCARTAPRRVRTAARHGPVADGAARRRQRRAGRRPAARPAPGRRAAAHGGQCVAEFDATAPVSSADGCDWSRRSTIGPWFRWASVGIDCAPDGSPRGRLAVTGDPPDRRPRRRQPGRDMTTDLGCAARPSPRGSGSALGIAITVCFVTGLISHFIQHPQPWFFWPTRPVWLYRVHAGPARHLRHRGDTAARRQAVVGVAQAVRAAAHRWRWSGSSSGVDPGAGGVDALSAQHRAAEHRAVVCVQVLLHHQPLRDGLRRRRRGARAHRGQAAGHPTRAGRTAGRRRRCGAAGRRGGRCCAARGWPSAWRPSSPRARRCRCCARCRCWRHVPGKGRKGFR